MLVNTSLILSYVTLEQQQVDENEDEVEDSNEGNYCCYMIMYFHHVLIITIK